MGSGEILPTDNEVVRVRLGLMLRKIRSDRKLTGVQVGKLANMSQGKISKIETGAMSAVSELDIERILGALDADDASRRQVQAQLNLLRISPRSYDYIVQNGIDVKQREHRIRERGARFVCAYEPILIPGLLQLPDYSRGIFAQLRVPEEQHGLIVGERVKRQEILWQQGRGFEFILGHSALYSAPGGPDVQLAQLDRLETLAGSRNIAIGIVPSRAPIPVRALNGFTILDGSFVSSETVIAEQLSTDGNEIRAYIDIYSKLRDVAAWGQDAVALIRTAVSHYS